jgi:hypothetical protein
MRYLADLLGIQFGDILLVPTFDKFPIKARGEFEVEDHAIANGAVEKQGVLAKRKLDTIERMTSETYAAVLNKVIRYE